MNKYTKKTLSIIFLLILSAVSRADDTDFINIDPPVNSNALFIMDMSGSMEKDIAGNKPPTAPAKSRKDILHEALKTVLTDPALMQMNVGIMSFSGYAGADLQNQRAHGITYPISPLVPPVVPPVPADPLFHLKGTAQFSLSKTSPEVFTHKDTSWMPVTGGRTTAGYIGDVIPTTWVPKGGTPIVDALYEAARYFRGDSVFYGRYAPNHKKSAHPSTYNGTLTAPPVVTTTNVCNTVSCASGSCNVSSDASKTVTLGSPSCSTTSIAVNCTTSGCVSDVLAVLGSCSASVNSRLNCGQVASLAAPTLSCGKGTNCANELSYAANRYCPYGADIATCIAFASGQGWSVTPSTATCPTQTNSICGPSSCPGGLNDAGICDTPVPGACSNKTRYVCSENIYVTKCDQDVTPCSKPVTSCTHELCGDVTTTTYPVVGTANYKTPITDQCAKNRIILLSDGKATLNSSANSVASYIGAYANSCASATDKARCGKEMAKFLASEDNNTGLAGDQFINTYTIGFALNNPKAVSDMTDIASEGGGAFLMANTPASLATALRNALTSVSEARSFSSPSYASSASSLSDSDYIYLPVFDKGAGPMWAGNLKKFKRANGVIEDKDGNVAITAQGKLLASAKDFWTTGASTDSIKSGGFANMINPVTRRIYTDSGAGSLITLDTSLANTLFERVAGTVDNAYKANLVSFIKGFRSDGITPRHHMGAIIHSKPVHIKIGSKDVMFVGTNEGYLHAIDVTHANPDDGKEIFAYMPQELLKNIDTQYKNDVADKHPYGVDGRITVQHDDINKNGIVDGGEKVILYFGLRRGGRSYYALNVTNLSTPKLEWRKDESDYGAELGFTWSQPVVTKMKVGAVRKDVLVVGGGYIDDNNVLSGGTETDDGATLRGRGVYIIDANTGNKITKVVTTKRYAVPARVRVLDTNRDGLADRFYFGDTGGYIWRVDFTAANILTQVPTVSMFADLSTIAAPATKQRKFFAEPDIATFKSGGKYISSVSIGSGERPQPLDMATDDHFFVLFDQRPFGAPLATITKSHLYERSSIPAGQTALSGGKKGWYMDLTQLNGEKVLSSAMTYQNVVLFSTFGSSSISASACGDSNVNKSILYAFDLLKGQARSGLGVTGTPIGSGEIPDATQVIFDELTNKNGGACKLGDCVQPTEFLTGKGFTVPGPANTLNRVFWIDEE